MLTDKDVHFNESIGKIHIKQIEKMQESGAN